MAIIRVLAEFLVGLGFLSSISYIKSIPTLENLSAVGKSGPNVTLINLFFLGLEWPWVGEFVVLIIMFICFPTQHNLVNRKRPIPLFLEGISPPKQLPGNGDLFYE